MLTAKKAFQYYLSAEQSYPICEEFMQLGYRQKRGGYLTACKKLAENVDPAILQPTQKEHILSYCQLSREDGTIPNDAYDFKLCLGRLKCCELLLYCCEASGVDPALVRRAAKEAEEIIDSGDKYARLRAAKRIRELVSPQMVEDAILSRFSS